LSIIAFSWLTHLNGAYYVTGGVIQSEGIVTRSFDIACAGDVGCWRSYSIGSNLPEQTVWKVVTTTCVENKKRFSLSATWQRKTSTIAGTSTIDTSKRQI